MAVQIQIDQAMLPPGLPGVAREDLTLGMPAILTAVGGAYAAYLWRIIHVPIDIVAGVKASSVLATPTASASLLSPLDVAGTYHVEVSVDSGSGLGALPEDIARITFYAGPALSVDPGALPRRTPAFDETMEHNVPDAIEPLGNTEGWSREWYRWFEVIKRAAAGSSGLWGRVNLPVGGPATLVDGINVSGVNRITMGVVDITFATPLPNANYAVITVARGTPGGSCVAYNETVNGFRIERADFAGGLVDADFAFDVRVRV
jgi:hypothetical protein